MLIDEILSTVKPVNQRIAIVLERLKHSKVIRGQNVADYINASPESKDWDLQRDYPNVAPSFEDMWIEWIQPLASSASNPEHTVQRFPVGVHLASFDLKALDRANLKSWFGSYFPEDLLRKSRWISVAVFIMKMDRDRLHCPPLIGWGVSEEGAVNFPENELFCDQHPFVLKDLTPEQQKSVSYLCWYLRIPFMCLSLMHCKNVELEKGPAHPERLQRSRQKKGKLPLVRWHTLVIEPVKKIIADANGGNPALTPKSLHICRGHFKHFTDKGLFGKFHGSYWWNSHKRGSMNVGIVRKDYEPRPAETALAPAGVPHG